MASYLERVGLITWLIAFCCLTPYIIKVIASPAVVFTMICVSLLGAIVWYFLDRRPSQRLTKEQQRDYAIDVPNGNKKRKQVVSANEAEEFTEEKHA